MSRLNPEFLDMGDEYWTPGIILTTWNQADTGQDPGLRGGLSRPV